MNTVLQGIASSRIGIPAKDNTCTRTCLLTAEKHAHRFGIPTSLACHFDANAKHWYRVTARWNLKPLATTCRRTLCNRVTRRYTYRGVSWGYGGEGPNGLADMIKMFVQVSHLTIGPTELERVRREVFAVICTASHNLHIQFSKQKKSITFNDLDKNHTNYVFYSC